MNTKTLCYISIFASLICVLSTVSIPTPFGVPFTLQTFAISFCGFILGKKYSTFTVFIYLLLGAIGLPVFAGLSSGIDKFFSLSGGFLYGFLFLAFFSGFNKIILSLIGLFICHLLGVLQYSLLTHTNILSGFLVVSIPYLLKDIISIFLAYIVANKLKIIKIFKLN